MPTTRTSRAVDTAREESARPAPNHRDLPNALSLGLSPYHLSTREVPAMCALVLGDHIATLLPEPPEGANRDEVKKAALAAPRFFRLLDSWRWSEALWQAGVLAGQMHNAYPLRWLDAIYHDIASDPGNAVLARLSQPARDLRIKSPTAALDAMCADLMRGGPDPGLSIAITGAIDRCCAAHGGWSVRGAVDSLTQRAESLLARRVFSFAMPLLTQADGDALLAMRSALEAPLADLRAAMTATMSHALQSSEPCPSDLLTDLANAAAAYRAAFERWSVVYAQGDDQSGQRIVIGYVNVTSVILPADAAIRSARAAAVASGSPRASTEPGASPALLPALIVREMNARPA